MMQFPTQKPSLLRESGVNVPKLSKGPALFSGAQIVQEREKQLQTCLSVQPSCGS